MGEFEFTEKLTFSEEFAKSAEQLIFVWKVAEQLIIARRICRTAHFCQKNLQNSSNQLAAEQLVFPAGKGREEQLFCRTAPAAALEVCMAIIRVHENQKQLFVMAGLREQQRELSTD